MDKLIWTMICGAASAIRNTLTQPLKLDLSDFYDWKEYERSQQLRARVAYVKLSPAERQVHRYLNGD